MKFNEIITNYVFVDLPFLIVLLNYIEIDYAAIGSNRHIIYI